MTSGFQAVSTSNESQCLQAIYFVASLDTSASCLCWLQNRLSIQLEVDTSCVLNF